MNSSVSPYCALRFSLSAQKLACAGAADRDTAAFPLGLFVGLLLFRGGPCGLTWPVQGIHFVVGSCCAAVCRFRHAGSQAFVSALAFWLRRSVSHCGRFCRCLSGIWLPAALCIYREAPDWSFLYLLPPDRATRCFWLLFYRNWDCDSDGIYSGTVLAASDRPAGLQAVSSGTKERGDAQRESKLGGFVLAAFVSFATSGTLLAMRAGSERLFWVGSYADFHDGRWLLCCSLGVARLAAAAGDRGACAPCDVRGLSGDPACTLVRPHRAVKTHLPTRYPCPHLVFTS